LKLEGVLWFEVKDSCRIEAQTSRLDFMRLWSLHPKYLDSKGLVALWREALLAQKVIRGETKGYRRHPQLIRFKESSSPLGSLATYLEGVHHESIRREYRFDVSKIADERLEAKLSVTESQVSHEMEHLLKKLWNRDRAKYQELKDLKDIEVHPIFVVIPGEIAEWEVIS
jgi:hypothetical protein